jgi:hypothetical protein
MIGTGFRIALLEYFRPRERVKEEGESVSGRVKVPERRWYGKDVTLGGDEFSIRIYRKEARMLRRLPKCWIYT